MDRNYYPYYFTYPAVILFLLIFVTPTLIGFGYAFTDWNIYNPEINFVGFENFKKILDNDNLQLCIRNTVFFALFTCIGRNIIGLLLALALCSRLKTKVALRTIFYLPVILSYIVVGVVFTMVLHPEGILNTILSAVGLEFMALQWLADRNVVMFTVSIVDIWKGAGFHMVIFIAALMSIPHEYSEASKIDGANAVQQFFKIKLPLIMQSVTINIILSLIAGFKVFEQVYLLTNGGPGYASSVMNTVVFQMLGEGTWGMGTAINLVLFIVIAVVTLIALAYLKRKEIEI